MSTRSAQSWALRLGLVAAPLFGHERRDPELQHLALLDGMRSSFLLSSDVSEVELADTPDWAWSSNVRHHITLQQKKMIVSRDTGSTEIFERASVESRLPEFLRYLELDVDPRMVGPVDHLIRLFRQHRATLHGEQVLVPDLQSFLYLLALTQEADPVEAHRNGDAVLTKYGISAFNTGDLNDQYVTKFVDEAVGGSPSMRRLLTPLTIRHAGGSLFQEAHAEVLVGPVQLTLFGLAKANTQLLDLSSGVYYTPIGLARALTEIALEPFLKSSDIRISDPACGSGIFLCEAIRTLQRQNYGGKIRLTGRDLSPVAAQMARFSVTSALLDWPGHQVTWEIKEGNFLEASSPRQTADVVLMNPPFRSWEALTAAQKDVVRAILGPAMAGRPDLSTAFIQKALNEIQTGGTVATLLPRGVLDSQQGAKWRESVLATNNVRLIGTFADHGLFQRAMVSIGAAVFERSTNSTPTIMVWADEGRNSAERALRGLRRLRGSGNWIEERSHSWSVYPLQTDELHARKSWLPTPNALGSLLEIIKQREFPSVRDVFRVRQGIKTGLNEAFLISAEELERLPKNERGFFRPAVNGQDIVNGCIFPSSFIFYVPDLFSSKRALLAAAPVFGGRLLKHEAALKRRPKSNPKKWWEPIWPRKPLAHRIPRIVSKMFGAIDMASVDVRGELLPLQAYAWIPDWSAIGVEEELKEAALWWLCRVINSRIFFLLRREFAAAITAGGQLDVSPKYIDDVPIPMPTADDLLQLAAADRLDVTASRKNDELVALAYGTSLDAWPLYASH